MHPKIALNYYDKTSIVNSVIADINDDFINFDDVKFDVLKCSVKNASEKITSFKLELKLKSASVKNCSLSLNFRPQGWSEKNYVFSPSALYNGNRYKSYKLEYPPSMLGLKEVGERMETIITDVPRLSLDGKSKVQLNVGDMATPCIGYFSPDEKKGYLIFIPQKNELGNFGVTVSESDDRKNANITITSPCMREFFKYGMCTTTEKSDDKSATIKTGDKVSFRYNLHEFHSETITEFLNYYFEFRRSLINNSNYPNMLPWSSAFKIIEGKYNKRNWIDNIGFYKSSEAKSGICSQWQTGWVGGTMNTLPNFVLGNELSVERSSKTLDFVFTQLQAPSGFLYGIFYDGKIYGDDFKDSQNKNIVMSRKNADALYYLAKQLLYLKSNEKEIKPLWHNGLKKLADAFCSFYYKNGQLGQFIDIESEKVIVGVTASAGIASAGLLICYDYFKDEQYVNVAEALGDVYYESYVANGFTNGGPGEIANSPDSESAFALLESYVALFEHTRNNKWLKYAIDIASLCSSWCVSFDYENRKNTQFYERDICTTGAVFANVQNKHAAPGICTLSGSSLFRLFRMTGNVKYLDLLKDITHNITQFVSTKENPIRASYVWHNNDPRIEKFMSRNFSKLILGLHKSNKVFEKLLAPAYDGMFNKEGCINERVNLSDWEGTNNVGEIPLGSCWCEVSVMLTYLENPSIYIQKDTGFVYSLDHVECSVVETTENEITLKIYNPTKYDSEYRLFAENSNETFKPILDMCLEHFEIVKIRAGETVQITI